MGISAGNIFAQGILGAVTGGSASMVHEIDRENKKKDELDLETAKAEIQKRRDEYLAKLSRETHSANAKTDIENIPAKGAAETAVAVDKRKALDPLDVQKAEDEARGKKKVEGEFIDQDVKRAGLVAGATSNAQIPADIARARAVGEETRKTRADDDSRERYIDKDGNYRRKDDNSIIVDVQREGGRELARTPVKAPLSKVEGRQETYSKEDEIKFVQSQILKIQGKEFKSPEDMADLKRLQDNYDLLTGKKKPGAGPAPANRPPLSSFGK